MHKLIKLCEEASKGCWNEHRAAEECDNQRMSMSTRPGVPLTVGVWRLRHDKEFPTAIAAAAAAASS